MKRYNEEWQFYYLMKLHYSQTRGVYPHANVVVLLPYEITLFSNELGEQITAFAVLLPYEITLFSNLLMSVKIGSARFTTL
mgnify:CR=1 FL=1